MTKKYKMSEYKRGLQHAVCRGYGDLNKKDWCGNYEHDFGKEKFYVSWSGSPICESCFIKICAEKGTDIKTALTTPACDGDIFVDGCKETINIRKEPAYFVYGEIMCSDCADKVMRECPPFDIKEEDWIDDL